VGGAAGGGPCCSDFGGPFGPDGTQGSIPAGAAAAFAMPSAGSGGPCLYEPQDGTLFPNNWVRPRFSWTATGDLYELTLSGGNQLYPLVIYTTATSWTMSPFRWVALARDTQDMPLTVTIRSALAGGAPRAGTSSTFTIAPAAASGTVAYVSPTSFTALAAPALNGFAIGGESVEQLLIPSDVTSWQTADQGLNRRAVTCIGCHTATPDGYVSFNDAYPWGGVIASVKETLLGSAPTFLGVGGYQAFTQPWMGMTTYSPAHWSDGDHIAVASLGTTTNDSDQQPGLAWFDLESTAALSLGQSPFTALRGTAWNWIYQPTSGAYAASPSWSHAGDFVVFSMTSNVSSGHLGTGTSHLYRVPYSRSGPQTATPLAGGSASSSAQYDPALSPDDSLVVFDLVPAATAAAPHSDLNRADCTSGTTCIWPGMYMQPAAELYIAPTTGGSAVRLAANDPPACPGQQTSPGIDNARASWAPSLTTVAANGNTYYWLVFSSWRQGATDSHGEPLTQLFVTAVVRPEAGPLQTYPAIYLWNQPAGTFNGTPAWGTFPAPAVTP
jgi:hypothetical protein